MIVNLLFGFLKKHPCRAHQKKTDVVDHPQVFHHVGLLINEPPGAGLNQTNRIALYLVIRRLVSSNSVEATVIHS
jgi:hypothetical protein